MDNCQLAETTSRVSPGQFRGNVVLGPKYLKWSGPGILEDLLGKNDGKGEFSPFSSLIAFLVLSLLASAGILAFFGSPICPATFLWLCHSNLAISLSRVAAKSAYSITCGTGRSLIHTIFTSAISASNRNWNICRFLLQIYRQNRLKRPN